MNALRQTLRPGLLVGVKTSLRGNVRYETTDLGTQPTGDGGEEARWQTDRHIADKAELETAQKARSKARSLVASVCAHSAFGLLCLESRADELDKAVREAEQIAAEFNATAKVTRLSFNVIVGLIAPDDARAIRAINSEMSDLMAAMAEGMKNLDVRAIRDAADRARSVGQMLTPDMQEKVSAAIAKVAEARTAFLDLEEQGEIGEVEHAGRAVDLDPDSTPEPGAMQSAAPAQARLFEV